jgi:hypothetical protein
MNNSDKTINSDIDTNITNNEHNDIILDAQPVVQKSKRGRKPNSLNKKTLEQNKLNALKNESINANEEIKNEDATGENEIKPVIKKRGRKPKGGKIIHNVMVDNTNKIEKPNIILHLKCFLKDIYNTTEGAIDNIDSYKFPSKNNLSYDVIHNEDTNSIIDNNISHSSVNNTLSSFASQKSNKIIHIINTNKSSSNVNVLPTTSSTSLNNNSNYNPNYIPTYDTTIHNSDGNSTLNNNDTKEIYKKLKDLEMNLHLNNIQDKKSACFWCTCDFDNPPIYIPKHYLKESYHVYGCFCTPECGVAYLMNENIDSSIKFERFHLINHIYAKIYNYTKNIKPAPSPFYMLEKYYGNLSINEYRALIRNDRLFLIVDKPLTRIMPELHIDNEDFIINNKIISTNNFQINKKSHKVNNMAKNNLPSETLALYS